MDYLCSGTLLRRMKMCGKPGCRCSEDPDARHGPYYEWGHMNVPEGFANGYQALTDEAEVAYLVSVPYAPGAEGGVRYDDPEFPITWPIEVTVVSDKDRAWPNFVG